jgi:hypothetical protein
MIVLWEGRLLYKVMGVGRFGMMVRHELCIFFRDFIQEVAAAETGPPLAFISEFSLIKLLF